MHAYYAGPDSRTSSILLTNQAADLRKRTCDQAQCPALSRFTPPYLMGLGNILGRTLGALPFEY